MNIRVNRFVSVRLPEWERGSGGTIRTSPAAYAIAETSGRTISIEVSLRGAPADSAFVRAVSIDQSFSNRFADVSPQRADFTAAEPTVTLQFNLENVRLREVGVNAYDVRWRWEHGPTEEGPWTPFVEPESRHRIYSVIRLPEDEFPWSLGPLAASNDQLPWADVLEFACEWARGAQTTAEAATLITQEVYALGRTFVDNIPHESPGTLLKYHGNVPRYADTENFFCSLFIKRLRRQKAEGPWVTCDDCSCIVSTFANVLGCRLTQAWLGDDDPGFRLNPVLLIGAAPDGWRGGHFNHHAVAWEGAAGADDEVFDACLLVDGDANPTAGSASHTEMLAANLRFGRVGERFYRWRLVHPAEDPENSAPLGNVSFKAVI